MLYNLCFTPALNPSFTAPEASLIPVQVLFFFFYKFIYFIYLFLAVLGLHCCVRAFSSCGEQGLLFVVVRGLLIAVASLVTEHRL